MFCYYLCILLRILCKFLRRIFYIFAENYYDPKLQILTFPLENRTDGRFRIDVFCMYFRQLYNQSNYLF